MPGFQTLIESGCHKRAGTLHAAAHRTQRPSLEGPSGPPSRHITIKMAAVQTLPKDVSKLGSEVKLFGKWDTQECVTVSR